MLVASQQREVLSNVNRHLAEDGDEYLGDVEAQFERQAAEIEEVREDFERDGGSSVGRETELDARPSSDPYRRGFYTS